MATHSRIFAWKIPWMEEPDELQAMELQKSGTDLVTKQQQSLEKEWNSFWFEAT